MENYYKQTLLNFSLFILIILSKISFIAGSVERVVHSSIMLLYLLFFLYLIGSAINWFLIRCNLMLSYHILHAYWSPLFSYLFIILH